MTRFLHSSSAHKYLDGCPQQFWLYQTGATKGPSPDHFRFGIAAHLVMQMYVDWCIANSRRTDVTVIGNFIDDAARKTRLPLSRYDELSALIRGYLDVYEVDLDHSIEREGGIAFDANMQLAPWSEAYDYDQMKRPMDHAEAGVMLRLRLDEALVYPDESRLVVRDFKTDVYVPSQSEIDDPSSRFNAQARLYAMAAWRRYFPADIVEVEFDFMRRVAYGRALKRRLMFTKDEILEIEEQTLAKIRYVEALTEFPARPGDRCAACSFRDTSCPVPAEKLDTDPSSIARRFLYQRVQQEILRDRIKEHVAQFGWTGEMGALRAEFEQGESQKPDMRKVWNVLQDVGFDAPWSVMSFSDSQGKALLDKDIYERIKAEAFSPDIAVRFHLHQSKPELIALAETLGIPTRVPKKDGKSFKDKTVAQLAWDLAQWAAANPADAPTPAANDEPAVEWSDVRSETEEAFLDPMPVSVVATEPDFTSSFDLEEV